MKIDYIVPSSVSSAGKVVASRNVTLYHYVGRVNVICSFHSRQRGESDPCALGYGRRVI